VCIANGKSEVSSSAVLVWVQNRPSPIRSIPCTGMAHGQARLDVISSVHPHSFLNATSFLLLQAAG
jgi:hypothetical protein